MTDRDLFIAVLNLDDMTERQAYLQEACGDDLSARRRVEALLKVYENAGSFLESPPASPPPRWRQPRRPSCLARSSARISCSNRSARGHGHGLHGRTAGAGPTQGGAQIIKPAWIAVRSSSGSRRNGKHSR